MYFSLALLYLHLINFGLVVLSFSFNSKYILIRHTTYSLTCGFLEVRCKWGGSVAG